MSKSKHIGEQLRAVILAVPSRNELARRAGVTPGNISYFMTRKRDITMDTGAKLAAALGLRLVGPDKPIKLPPAGKPGLKPTRKAR